MTVEVSTVPLKDGTTVQTVEAELRDAIEDAQLDDWRSQWQPHLEKLKQGIPKNKWPQSVAPRFT